MKTQNIIQASVNVIKYRLYDKDRGIIQIYTLNELIAKTFRRGKFEYRGTFTGLKDKNGKMIFENDICEVEYLKDKYIGQVDFKNGGFWIVKHNGYGGEGYFISDIYDDTMIEQGSIKVLGNIFEHANLLK